MTTPDRDFDELLRDLNLLGVRVWAEDGRVRYRAPHDLDDALLARMHRFRTRLSVSFACSGDDYDCMVRMTPLGAKAALFCPHSLAGSALVYWRLAERISNSITLYAFENQRLLRTSTNLPTIREMARNYIERMRIVQPEGPYSLFGFSSGGLIAIEMAQQLIAAGVQVNLLALGDTQFSSSGGAERNASAERFAWVIFSGIFFSRRVQDFLISIWESDAAFWNQSPIEKLKRLSEIQDQTQAEPSRSLAILRNHLTAFMGYVQTYTSYSPKPYPGHITYFRAAGFQPPPTEAFQVLACESLEIIDVPGMGHMQIVQPPGVNLVADVIGRIALEATVAP